MATLRFHSKRAEAVLLPLVEAARARTHLFEVFPIEDALPQQGHIPPGVEKGSYEHLVFLFFTSLITLRSVSDEGFRGAVRLYVRNPELFHLDAVYMREEEVLRAFTGAYIQHQEGWARYWIECARTLHGVYRGDPVALVKDVKTVEGFLKKKKAYESARRKDLSVPPYFTGLGPKLFSMYCLFLYELGVLKKEVPDAVPVDVHLQNTCLGRGIVTGVTHEDVVNSTMLEAFLRPRLCRFCKRHDITLSELSGAMWLHGSKGCRNCSRFKNPHGPCPVVAGCSGRLATERYWKAGMWDPNERDQPGVPQGYMYPEVRVDRWPRVEFPDELARRRAEQEKRRRAEGLRLAREEELLRRITPLDLRGGRMNGGG